MSAKTMKAWVLTKTYAKGVDFEQGFLELQDLPLPEIKDDELLVQVKASGVNPVDYKVGAFGGIQVPRVIGFDVAGIVSGVGSKVNGFKVGDRVYYHANIWEKWGGYAEYSTIRAVGVCHIPKDVDFVSAASLPTAGWTAWVALFEKARVRKGETVFITAASGGVGSFAVQLAKLHGCEVIATCSGKNKDLVKKLGADHVIDYSTEDILARVKEITGGRGVDAWIDMVGSDSANTGLKALAFGGNVVVVQGNPTTPIGDCFSRQLGVLDVFLGGAWKATDKDITKLLTNIGNEMVKLVEQKKVVPLIAEVVKFTDLPKSLSKVKEGHAGGKIVASLE